MPKTNFRKHFRVNTTSWHIAKAYDEGLTKKEASEHLVWVALDIERLKGEIARVYALIDRHAKK